MNVESEIASTLQSYLGAKLLAPGMRFIETPVRLTGGYDATIYAFRLANAPSPFDRPLVLRILRPSSPQGRATREAAVQNALADESFPAPHVHIVEEGHELFGGPFLIMERVPGKALGSEFEGLGSHGLRETLRQLRRFPQVRREMVRLWADGQTRLEQVSVDGFLVRIRTAGLDPASFQLGAWLKHMQAEIAQHDLAPLAPLVDWLVANQPKDEFPRVVCHGDLQPFNVLVEDGRITSVIDWGVVVIADPAFHYGGMLALFAIVPLRAPPGLRWLMRRYVAGLARSHAKSFCQARGDTQLVYWQVLNCATQLFAVSRKRALGDSTSGIFNSPEGMAALRQHIQRLIGLKLIA